MPILPHIYFSHLQSLREQTFLWEKVSKQIRPLYWRELGMRINSMARGLDAVGIGYQDRVGVLTKKNINCFFTHLTTQVSGAVSVCFTKECTFDAKISGLRESNVKVVFVDDMSAADALLKEAGRLPQLTHIITMEAIGTTRDAKPSIITFLDLIEKGKSAPDKSISTLKKIQPSDRALLLYSPSDSGSNALLQTHEDLSQKYAEVIQSIPPHTISQKDVLLVAASFHESPMHFAVGMLPLHYGCQALYAENDTIENLMLTNLNPTIIIGDSHFLNSLKSELLELSQDKGKPDSSVFVKAAKLGRARFERPNKLTFSEKLADKFMRSMFLRRFREHMGTRLRAVVSTDTNTSYDTQVFFYSFGVDLYELDTDN